MSEEYKGICYLEKLPYWNGKQFSPLEVPKRLLEVLGNPQDRLKSVHVAGTNGKGSVCSLIAAVLRAQGANVGQFASPHLGHVTERCLINGVPVDIESFDAAVIKVMNVAIAESLNPSYFVVSAVATFVEFARRELDWIVVEVGLGGSYDATNVLSSPRVSVITHVGFDHTNILGETIELIAQNKAGIIKRGVPVFVGQVEESVEQVIRLRAHSCDARIEFLNKDFVYDRQNELLSWKGGSCRINSECQFAQAEHQLKNVLLGVRVASFLGANEQKISKGLTTMRWPGRLEKFSVPAKRICSGEKDSKHVSFLLDAAHNSDGVAALLAHLRGLLEDRSRLSRVVFVVSMLRRKNWTGMLEQLSSFVREYRSYGVEVIWVFTSVDETYSVPPLELKAYAGDGVLAAKVSDALRESVCNADGHTLVVVLGSILLIGAARELLTDQPFRTIAAD